MCLGIPGKVVWIKEMKAGVDFGEVVCEAATHLVEDLEIGDLFWFTQVYPGKMDMDEAEQTLSSLNS